MLTTQGRPLLIDVDDAPLEEIQPGGVNPRGLSKRLTRQHGGRGVGSKGGRKRSLPAAFPPQSAGEDEPSSR